MLKPEERFRRIDYVMSQNDIDGLLCCLPENVFYFSGYWPLSGFAILLYMIGGESLLIIPEAEFDFATDSWVSKIETFKWGVVDAPDPEQQIRSILQAWRIKHVKKARLGYEDDFRFMAPPYNSAEPCVPTERTRGMLMESIENVSWVGSTNLLYKLRSIKTLEDLKGLRLVNEIACEGLKVFRNCLYPGMTEVEVSTLVERVIAVKGINYKGARCVRAWAFVMSGINTSKAYKPFNLTTNRVLQEGDPVTVELVTSVDGYWSDLTRTGVVGEPNLAFREIYEIVLEAQKTAIKGIRSGVSGADIDGLARTIIQKAGYGANFVHHTGHGVGFRYHEPIPILHPLSTGELATGMVTSVEPGIYISDFGVRIEDNVFVMDEKCEVLSTYDWCFYE